MRNIRHRIENISYVRIKLLPHECIAAADEKCPACKEACERQKSLYEHIKDQACKIETQTTITKYIEVVQQSTIRKLSQSFDAEVM